MLRPMLCALVLVLACSPAFAQDAKVPGQLIDLKITGGMILHPCIFLQGEIGTAGAKGCALPNVAMFINDISAEVSPHNKFGIMFPIATLQQPPDPAGHIVTVIAWQRGTNVKIEKKFNLADLNHVLKQQLTFEQLFQQR